MRSCVAIAVLALAATPVVGADGPGLSAEMWERVRAVEPTALELTPTPSPLAPETLSLKECVALALRHNSGYRDDQQRLVNARRGLWVAGQRLLPTLSAQAERGRDPGTTTETAVSMDLAARWEGLTGGALEASLDTGTQSGFSGLLHRQPASTVSYEQPVLRGFGLASSTAERIRSARTALSSQELSFYDGHEDLAQRVIEGYYEVLLARGEVEIAQRAVGRAKQLYDINYAKFTGEGLVQPGEQWVSQVAEIDVDQARLSWERSKQQLISRQQAYRDGMDRLLLDMGLSPGANPELTTQIAYAPQEYDEAELVQTALRNSTELGRLQLARQDAIAARRIARSERLPDISATAGVSDLGESVSDEEVSRGWFAGLVADIPLWDRRRAEDADRADRALKVLDQQIVARSDAVAQQVQRLARAAASSRARIDIGEQSVALASKSREAAQGMYDEGLSDYLRVLDAEDRLVEAERSLLQEQVQYFLTTVQMRRATGEEITQGLPE